MIYILLENQIMMTMSYDRLIPRAQKPKEKGKFLRKFMGKSEDMTRKAILIKKAVELI